MSRRFMVVGLVLALIVAVLGACSPAPAVPAQAATDEPTVVVSEPTEEAANPQQGGLVPADSRLVVIQRRGGLCVSGSECAWTMTVLNNGSYTAKQDENVVEGRLSEDQVVKIRSLIAETDFQSILATPFTDTCPIAYDGQESVYTVYPNGEALELASCTVVIDPALPLFAMLDQIAVEASQ